MSNCSQAFPQPMVEDRMLPSNPFYSLRYHFGMLLGVEDFETEQSYHRGKHRLHNAWLHRAGVVWGLEVTAPTLASGASRNEIEVTPGLALDAAGNELHLDAPMCVDIGRWYEDRKAKGDFSEDDETVAGGRIVVELEAYVVATFNACLMRPVPALMEPCEGSGSDTAYSRAFESLELLLVPGTPPAPDPLPYHRLRLLFGLEGPHMDGGAITAADQDVLAARDTVEAAAAADRPPLLLDAFRWCAALDVIELQGVDEAERGSSRFPVDGRPTVLLASITGIRISRDAAESEWRLERATIDNTVRPSHVATATIQELLCGPAWGAASSSVGPRGVTPRPRTAPVGADVTDANGPRVMPDSVRLRGTKLEFRTTKALSRQSVSAGAIAVQAFDRKTGWTLRKLGKVEYDAPEHRVVIHLADKVSSDRVRLVVRGTGDAPILGSDFIPLAGGSGGPPGTMHDGTDFMYMLSTRSPS